MQVTFNELLIYGSLSCVFWTLTLQTTIKYILITLTADNNGEGGIFALFALIRRKSTWAAILTMVGGGALLADGVITPAITVTTSIEGLKIFNPDISCDSYRPFDFCRSFLHAAVRDQYCWGCLWADDGGMVSDAGYSRIFTADIVP